MSKKMAVIGLQGLALSVVTTNSTTAYQSETAKALPFVGSLSRKAKEKKQDVYYDDELYGQINRSLGEDVEIRLGEITLASLAELGLGTFDATSGIFEGHFSPTPGTYSLRCTCDTISGLPVHFNWRVFELTGIRFDNFTTMGENIKVCEVIVTGVFKKPSLTTLAEYAVIEATGTNATACTAFMANGEVFPAA